MKVKVTIMRLFCKLLLSMASLFLSVACQQKAGPSTIVIAVDRLPFQSVNCSGDQAQVSGIHVLCQNSIRFTHGYTTSTMATPAMASILTGFYPIEHGLRSNADFLKAELITVPEFAAKAGYRTGFFSGGAPILARTGLNQGFENFDESIGLKEGAIFRKFGKSLESFISWIKTDVGSDSFFAVFYVPDLNFLDTESSAETGEARNLSYESQLEEFDSKLLSLIKFLKANSLWEQTRIILVGLSGEASNDRSEEFANINLHSENSQITLFIKPNQNPRDLGIKWTVDTNVSLTDVGQTLLTWFKGQNKSTLPLPSFSLDPLISEKDSQIPNDRKILIESAWASWKNLGKTRYALVDGQWFFLFDAVPKLFNTLTDRLEINPITFDQNEVLTKMKLFLYRMNLERFSLPDETLTAFMKIPYDTWTLSSKFKLLKDSLNKIFKRKNRTRWMIDSAIAKGIESEDWLWVRELAEKFKVKDAEALANLYTSKKALPFESFCLKLVQTENRSSLLRSCNDPYFLDFYNLMILGDSVSDFQKRKTQRIWSFLLDKRKIAMKDLALGQIWDVSEELGTSYSSSEIFVKLPINKKWVSTILNVKLDSK